MKGSKKGTPLAELGSQDAMLPKVRLTQYRTHVIRIIFLGACLFYCDETRNTGEELLAVLCCAALR